MKNELLRRLKALAPLFLDGQHSDETEAHAAKRREAAWAAIQDLERVADIWRRIDPAIEPLPLLPYQSGGSYAAAKAHPGE